MAKLIVIDKNDFNQLTNFQISVAVSEDAEEHRTYKIGTDESCDLVLPLGRNPVRFDHIARSFHM